MIKGKDLLLMARALSHEKDIPEEEVLDAIEKALAMAVRRRLGGEPEVRVVIDGQKGSYDMDRYWAVVPDGTEIPDASQQLTVSEAQKRFPDRSVSAGETIVERIDHLPGGDLGRIDAQVFKQSIMENVRKAERLKIVTAYSAKKGKLFTGLVKGVKRDLIHLEVNGVEACLLREETLPREAFRIGDKVRVYLYDVRYEPRGPQLFLSRSRSGMLVELFKLEVPEVGEELIEIKAAARDPGQRAKIAVKTNDGRIDPVGACVGMRGVRVQAISNELCGERVDIILWDDNPAQLVINAMAPAEVVSLMIDEDKHSMDVIVKEEQLSQAIGRNGQNVRLASELTGWSLNVMTQEEADSKQAQETGSLLDLFKSALDVDEDLAGVLIEEGFSSLEEVAFVPLKEFLAIEGFDEDIASELQMRAKQALEAAGMGQAKLDPEVLNLPHMTEELAKRLSAQKIVTRDDLAELATDDLVEMTGIEAAIAAEMIMAARAHWFE
jgi:N utilization substance protein A